MGGDDHDDPSVCGVRYAEGGEDRAKLADVIARSGDGGFEVDPSIFGGTSFAGDRTLPDFVIDPRFVDLLARSRGRRPQIAEADAPVHLGIFDPNDRIIERIIEIHVR